MSSIHELPSSAQDSPAAGRSSAPGHLLHLPPMGQKLLENLQFALAAMSEPRKVSTVFTTSRSLSNELLRGFDFTRSRLVVELGPGTGAITSPLLERLPSVAEYLGVEIVPSLVRLLRQKFPQKFAQRFAQCRFVNAPAEQLALLLEGRKADAIISSLPWSLMKAEEQREILSAIRASLRTGGYFATYVCLNAAWYPAAQRLRPLLNDFFREVERSEIVWSNLPPAFVYHCTC